jgi:hypothetical protein
LERPEDHQLSPEDESIIGDPNQWRAPFIYKEPASIESLQLNKETIERAKNAGIYQLLVDIARSFFRNLRGFDVYDNSYDATIHIIEAYKNSLLPILQTNIVIDLVIHTFEDPQTKKKYKLLISYDYKGFALEELENNGPGSVNVITSSEVMNYLDEPQILEVVVSQLIASAEEGKEIKNRWLSPMLLFRDLLHTETRSENKTQDDIICDVC